MNKKVLYLSLEENIISEVLDILFMQNKNDFSDCAVVFPSRRMGIFLKDEISKRASYSLILPEIFTIDDFFSYSYRLIHPSTLMIDEIKAVFWLYRFIKDEQKMFFASEEEGFLKNYLNLKMIFDALEEMSIESRNYDLKGFEEFVMLGEYHSEYKDFIKSLPEIRDGFYELLKDKGRYTRGMAYYEVGQNAKDVYEKVGFGNIIFAGFNSLSISEVKLFKAFLDGGKSLLIMKGDVNSIDDLNSPFYLQKKALEELEIFESEIEKREGKSWKDLSSKVIVKFVPDVESEMQVLRETLKKEFLKKNAHINKPQEMGIVLSRPQSLVPLIQDVISSFYEESIPEFNISLGYPFSRTPLFELIDCMVKVRESYDSEKGFYFKDYLSLVRHPYVKLTEKYQGEEFLRTGIHYIEDIIMEKNLFYFKEDELFELLKKEYGKREDFEKIFEELKEMHENFIFKGDGLVEFLKFLEASFKKIYGENKKRYIFLNEFVGEGLSAIDELKKFILGEEEFQEEKEFEWIGSFVKSFFESRRIKFFGSPLKGIQIMGLMEFRGLNFKKIIITDAVEGVFPSIFKYDPLLPEDVRAVFGMRNYYEREALIAYDFFTLLNSAEEVTIIVPRKIDGEFVEKSRFVERVLYELEKKGDEENLKEYSVQLYLKKDEVKEIKKKEEVKKHLQRFSFSPSSLEVYINCPLRFYYEKVLELKEREEITDEPDAGITGTIIHDSLKELYSDKELIYSGDMENLMREYEKIVDKNFLDKGFKLEAGMIKIRRWAILKKLKKFIEYDVRRIRESGVRILFLEEKLEKNFNFSSKISAMFQGRIDRVESEGGIYRVVDYKTGKRITKIKLKPEKIEELLELNLESNYFEYLDKVKDSLAPFQILLYIKLFMEDKGKDILEMEGSYMFLKEDVFGVDDIFSEIGSDDEKIEIFNVFNKVLWDIIKDVYENDYFLANPDKKKCDYCPYKLLCKAN